MIILDVSSTTSLRLVFQNNTLGTSRLAGLGAILNSPIEQIIIVVILINELAGDRLKESCAGAYGVFSAERLSYRQL